MKVLDIITGIFKPLTKLVDDVHTSTEEKLTLRNKLVEIENTITSQVLDMQKQLLTSQTKIITSEAQGQSWIQRNWRPITMLTFLALVVCDSFGWLANPLAQEAWTLLQIGLGGYVVGRTVEKVTPQVIKGIKE